MSRKVVAKMPVELQLSRNRPPAQPQPHARVITNRRIGQCPSLSRVNQLPHRRVEVEPLPAHLSQIRAERRTASPPRSDHRRQLEPLRHLARPASRRPPLRHVGIRHAARQMRPNPALQLQFRARPRQTKLPAQTHQLRLELIPRRKLARRDSPRQRRASADWTHRSLPSSARPMVKPEKSPLAPSPPKHPPKKDGPLPARQRSQVTQSEEPCASKPVGGACFA